MRTTTVAVLLAATLAGCGYNRMVAMREQIDTARAAGFNDYWTKPIDVRRMIGALADVLAK